VFAVDIDDAAIARLRKRLQEDGIENVTIVRGTIDDPKLPDRTLDAALWSTGTTRWSSVRRYSPHFAVP
jgi:ubiquinone/menaquinone biosynthesis C-methylase UbiE